MRVHFMLLSMRSRALRVISVIDLMSLISAAWVGESFTRVCAVCAGRAFTMARRMCAV